MTVNNKLTTSFWMCMCRVIVTKKLINPKITAQILPCKAGNKTMVSIFKRKLITPKLLFDMLKAICLGFQKCVFYTNFSIRVLRNI